MKQVTITIDHDEVEEILREHLAPMFPGLRIDDIGGLGYGDVTVRLRKPHPPIEAAPEQIEPPLRVPLSIEDEIKF